jgi:hypothetical protein
LKTYIVCCGESGRAVIVGKSETDPVSGEPIVLHDARMILYWSAECGGLLGLAANGPKTTTKITASVSSTGTGVVKQWVAVSDAAASSLVAWPSA